MHAPSLASQIQSPGQRDCLAGVCQSDCAANAADKGWFVPYRRVPGYSDAYEAVIELYIQDLATTFSDYLPFVIDTATDVTVIPRKLLKWDRAFPPSRALGRYRVQGLAGGVVVGLRFRAAVSIDPPQPGLDPLNFDEIQPVVVDYWEDSHGYVGLDVLRQVVMVSDREHVCLWRGPVNTCAVAGKADDAFPP